MDDDLQRQLLLADVAIAEGQAQVDSISATMARMARDGVDTSEARRHLIQIEETLQSILDQRDRLLHQLQANAVPPDRRH